MNTNETLLAIVRDTANQLDDAAAGRLYLVDGCREVIADLDAWMAAHEGEEEPQEVTVGDILSDDSLGGLRFEVDQRGEFLGGRTAVAYGGPNVWISCDAVRGYWAFDRAEWPLTYDAREAVADWFADRWDYVRESL